MSVPNLEDRIFVLKTQDNAVRALCIWVVLLCVLLPIYFVLARFTEKSMI